jgi:hypothetical protein
LGIAVDSGEFPGPKRKELGDEWEDEWEGWPTEKMKEQGMKSSLATVSVAIRILIRFLLLLIIFSQKSSSSKVGFLEALFGMSILGDAIVERVLTAFGSGVTNPLVGVMLTCQMVVFAIHNLSDRFSLLRKDLLPSPFLLLVLLCCAGILRSAFVLLRCRLGNAKLVDLRREC